jgi:ATP-dependent Clp endopeptidase proteolytic subunit ClpP
MPDQYRFRGHIAPDKGIRASVLEADVEDGVASIRLYDPIDSYGGDWGVSAKEFVTALDALPDDTATINLHINSPGGEVYEGISILNALRNHKARVVAIVDGLAASAASFVAAGADEVVMGRNSQLMIHDAWGIGIGPAAAMRDLAGRLDKISDNIASVYASKGGGTVEDWRTAMLAETWYSAEEAVAAGLADRVEAAQEPVNASFDLSVFQFAGREQAPPPAPVPGMSERQSARHRMAARKHGLTA